MDSNQTPEMSEHQRQQLQFQLFQESLPKVNEMVYWMLLNETVPLAISVENNLSKSSTSEPEASQSLERELDSKLTLSPTNDLPSHKLLQQYLTADEEKQAKIKQRLSNTGFLLGQKLSQLLIFSNNPNISFKNMDLLTVMKFVCRDVWRQMYGKQIDNLKTNHRGTFYLLDYNYKPIESFALEENLSAQEHTLIEPYLEIPCGVIRGVLESLGFQEEGQVVCNATIVEPPESSGTTITGTPPAISFNVQVLSTQ
ncbi:LANO_0E11584g1_1 [Lachancea nothofagi CBS 11611]|uniref:LANO_0E11584g1_1 n=1 Tax=Lachancea nothofagi CBS 11611 TaxID=1266666 RepID=A0A1G4JXL6_9SACH|nr:LANO_0E11584g1_1 [Lachancea nothofagi CBS 11611]